MKMKITRRQLRNLIRESIDREKLVRYIAGELSNRAYDLHLLDDINNRDPMPWTTHFLRFSSPSLVPTQVRHSGQG